MNLAYFRKSTRPVAETVSELKTEASAKGFKVLGEVKLDGVGTTVLLCRTEWLKQLLEADRNLVGFLPCAVSVITQGDGVLVGAGQASVLKAVSHGPHLAELAGTVDKAIRDIIHRAAGVGPLKPKAVKLYSTKSCPYCTMEKSWLEERKVPHEVVYVDQNQAEAEAMVEKTGQMGVPVTEIQYEDGEPEYVVGFDRQRLTQILSV